MRRVRILGRLAPVMAVTVGGSDAAYRGLARVSTSRGKGLYSCRTIPCRRWAQRPESRLDSVRPDLRLGYGALRFTGCAGVVKWHHGGFPSLKRGFDSRRPLVEDHGSNKALTGAALQLAGGLLLSGGMYAGFVAGSVSTFGVGVGFLAGIYFIISGSVRVYIGVLTRRAKR